jgi:hypothetical protein
MQVRLAQVPSAVIPAIEVLRRTALEAQIDTAFRAELPGQRFRQGQFDPLAGNMRPTRGIPFGRQVTTEHLL